MYVFLEGTRVKKCGLFSFFRSNKLKLVFLNKKEEYFNIELKSKKAYIGCSFEVPDDLKTIEMYATCENVKKVYTLDLKPGINEICFDFSFLQGDLRYVVEPGCFFTLLENVLIELDDNTLPKCEKHSVLVKEIGNGIFERKAYSDLIYFANIHDYIVNYASEKTNGAQILPRGWEKRYVSTGHEYYVNHNKNYTQWNRPEDPGDISDLLVKMDEYRRRTIPINILAMFDMTKFFIGVYRKYIIQSTADLFLTSHRNKFLYESTVIFAGEIGEDWGALFKEFVYKASIEFTNDERLKCIGCVYDIKTIDERKQANHPLLNYHLDLEKRTESSSTIGHPRIFDSKPISDALIAGERDSARINTLFERYIRLNPEMDKIERGYNILSDRDFYTYLGAFIGFALTKRVNIYMDLSLSFYENLLSRKFSIEHIQDPEFQSGIDYIRKSDLSKETIYDDYNDIPLTKETQVQYVDRLVHDVLYLSKKTEYDLIRDGFYRVVDSCISEYISTFELNYLLQGNEEVTASMLINSAVYLKCDIDTKEIEFLNIILQESDENFIRDFLQFVTGSPSVPIGSIKTNKFKWYIEQTVANKDMFFRATTCMNRLYIGSYESLAKMKEILLFSLGNTEGFHKI